MILTFHGLLRWTDHVYGLLIGCMLFYVFFALFFLKQPLRKLSGGILLKYNSSTKIKTKTKKRIAGTSPAQMKFNKNK